MKIGIFGGTFDPFTKAHEAIVKSVIDQNLVDEVWIIPTVVDYYRKDKTKWLSFDHRVEVIKNVIDKLKVDYIYKYKIFVDTTEIEFAENNAPYIVNKRRYIDTLNQFIYNENKQLKDGYHNEYYTIIGSDSYKKFKTWTNWKEILKLTKLIVVNGRNGENVQLDIPKIDLRIDSEHLELSATKIRKQYKNKSYIEYFADVFNNSIIESVRYQTPIFNLVKKTVPFLDFNPVGINSKDWVTMIAKDDDNFVMIKQLRYGLMKEQIEFPCGMVENGEHPMHAAIREFREETGYDLYYECQIEYLGKYAANPAFMNNYMHYFYVDLNCANYAQLKQNLDRHEKITVEYIPIEEVKQFVGTEKCSSVFMAMALKLTENYLCS